MEVAYTTFDAQESTDREMLRLAAILSGDIAELPAGSVGFASGLEYRREEGGVDVSDTVQLGDSGGNYAEPTNGDYDVTEAYAEFSIPMVSSAGSVSDRTGKVAGLVSGGSAYPECRSNFSVTLVRDNWWAGVTWRYLDEMEVFDVIDLDHIHTKADAVSYFDLLGTYDINVWSLAAAR